MKKWGAACVGIVVLPALVQSSGATVDVSTVPQLQAAVASLTPGVTIRIAPGRYALTQELRINGVTNVAIVGATGNRDDVVIVGTGMNTPGINIPLKVENAQDVWIADLSIGEAFWHPIQLKGESGAERVHIANVRLFDAGEQFIKSTVDINAPNGVDDVIVENSLIEYTVIGPSHGYTQGIDVLYGANWIVRRNIIRNIRVPAGAPFKSQPAILFWQGARNATVYGNTIINCERGIIFGLGPMAPYPFSHSGGAIYNNIIYRTEPVNADSGISVWDSPGTLVYHNTVIQNGTYPVAIEYRFPTTTGVEIINNLTDGAILQRDGASGLVTNNYTQATPSFFVNATALDLHLARTATAAIDRGVPIALVTDDWDGDKRPSDVASELGADEFYPWHITEPPNTLVAPGSLTAVVVNRSVRLSWIDLSTAETGYVVERADERRDGFRVVGRVAADGTAFTDSRLPRGAYLYRVRAVSSPTRNYSPYSTVVSAQIR